MKLLYKGKTKDVYEIDHDSVRLQFKDDVTGKDGVFDPGENQIGLSIEGIGKRNLAVATLFFEKLAENGIPTHFISSNLEEGSMDVKKCAPFGKGIEIIERKYAVGSFIRRYGLYAQDMMPLDDYVEITLKDDDRQDPLITEDALIALDILTHEQYASLVEQTKKIVDFIDQFLTAKNLQLIDIKLEFGVDTKGNVLLMDEIASGNMRVYKDGEKIDPEELTDLILA
ncbi:MAG: phosphoribosylaminoimidazolesuccinocarboxamide synthase [Clostridiaceae bacterium]|nr:phosphoribosylaminoimidazolesuccinocarboxamide synthase [Clostridiaceae bacterium]